MVFLKLKNTPPVNQARTVKKLNLESYLQNTALICKGNYTCLVPKSATTELLSFNLKTSVEHGFCGKSGRERQRIARREWLDPCRERFCRISRPDLFTKP